MSLIGLIMLMGLVTKNAILLVDYTKVLRGRGLDRREALITAGRTRLRPILMTTTAMIFGMLPLFFALGEGAEMRAPMARAVVGGLITSTLLTLIVVPVVYTILDDVTAWLFRRRKAERAVAAAVVAGGARGGVHRTRGRLPSGSRSRPRAGRRDAASPAAPSTCAAAKPPAPAAVKVLTLEEALAIAAQQNRDVQKAIEYRNWVQGKYVEERAAALPQATFAGSYAWTFDDTQSKLFENFDFGGGSGGDAGGGADIGSIFGGHQDLASGQFSVDPGALHVGAGRRRHPRGQAGVRLQRPAAAAVPAGGRAGRHVGVLERARRPRAGAHHRRGGRAAASAPRRDDEAAAAGTATDYDVLAARVAVDNARPAIDQGAEPGAAGARAAAVPAGGAR